MSRYAQFDEDGNQYQIASNLGWSQFGDWVDTLDAEKYPALVQLWEHGNTGDLEALRSQLDSALIDSPPHQDVIDSAELLLAALNKNTEAEVLLVTQ